MSADPVLRLLDACRRVQFEAGWSTVDEHAPCAGRNALLLIELAGAAKALAIDLRSRLATEGTEFGRAASADLLEAAWAGDRRRVLQMLRQKTCYAALMHLQNLAQEVAREVATKPPKKRGRSHQTKIDPKNRTKPMTLREAARRMGLGDGKDSAERLRAAIDAGAISCEHLTRQQHVFDRSSFPKEVWELILPRIKPSKKT